MNRFKKPILLGNKNLIGLSIANWQAESLPPDWGWDVGTISRWSTLNLEGRCSDYWL